MMKLIFAFLVIVAKLDAQDIPLCEIPNIANLTCIRIGDKLLQSEVYKVSKCEDWTPLNNKVLFFCAGKTKLSSYGNTYKCAEEGRWESIDTRDKGLPSCKITCPELFYQNKTTIVKDQNNETVPNDERIMVGAVLNVSCRTGFKEAFTFSAPNTIQCLETGEWSCKVHDCVDEKADEQIIQASINGTNTEIEHFPWHVGIYRYKDATKLHTYHCGGSIISEQVVVSAAHCVFTVRLGQLIQIEASKFRVAAGKTYRKLDVHETSEQYNYVSNIYTHNTYQHVQNNFADDIAVIVLRHPFYFNEKVKSIKLKIRQTPWFNPTIPTIGRVVGWGRTETNKLSDQLKYVDLNVVQCSAAEPHPGKFCAYSASTGASTCQGDSGSGFFIYQEVPYLIGVVSTSSSTSQGGTCQAAPATYNTFNSKENLFGYANKFLKEYFLCPESTIKCGAKCLPLSRVCDGIVDCSGADDEHEKNCTIRSSYGMYSKGLEILRYYEHCQDQFPNMIIPVSSIWLAAKYLSEVVTSSNVSAHLKADFGILKKESFISDIRLSSIVVAKLKSTEKLQPNKWTRQFFENNQNPPQQYSVNFFYSESPRIIIYYDSDITLPLIGTNTQFSFKNFGGNDVPVEGICVPTSEYTEISSEKVYRIKTNDDAYNLYLIKSDGDPSVTLRNLRASSLTKIKQKFMKSGPICFPKFKSLSTADYTPILFKLGYSYAFSLDPIMLQLYERALRVQVTLRAYIEIETADHQADFINSVEPPAYMDKSFFFILEDTYTSAIIFFGRILKGNNYTKYANLYDKCRPFSV